MPLNFSDLFNNKDGSINNPKLEEFFNKTRDAAETVSKRSAEGLELGRKKVELFDSKAKLSKLYERYGKLQYSAFIGEEVNPDELEDVANDIAILRDKVDLLNVEIEDARTAFNESMSAAARRTKEAFSQEKETTAQEVDEVEVVEAQVDTQE